MHENPRDVFIQVLEGEMELSFAEGTKARVEAGEFFVLPKHVRHVCLFKRMTIAVEGVLRRVFGFRVFVCVQQFLAP